MNSDRPDRNGPSDAGQPDWSKPPQFSAPPVQQPSGSKLLPVANPKALLAYYLGVASLIPCVALVVGPVAIWLGIAGLNEYKRQPWVHGKAHAIVGIVSGAITVLANLAGIGVLVFGQ